MLLLNKAGQCIQKLSNVPLVQGVHPDSAPASATGQSVLGPSFFYSPFLQHSNFLILLLAGTSLKDAFASLNLPNLFLYLQIQHPVTASSPTVPVGFFSVCFAMTFSSTVYPQVLVGLAATLGQRLWKAISEGSVHLSESDCAWEHSWVPQLPTPLGCAAPLAPQDQCLVPVTSPLLTSSLLTFFYLTLSLSYLNESDSAYFSFTPVSSLLCVALLIPIASALPADPVQTGRHGELPNIFSYKSSQKIITGFLCYIITSIPLSSAFPLIS